jgi:ferredoxin
MGEVIVEMVFSARRCAGHALCNATSPEVYELDGSGHLLAPPRMALDLVLVDSARDGAKACPERAIVIVDDGVAGEC